MMLTPPRATLFPYTTLFRSESGWNPFYENKGSKEFAKLFDAMNIFLRRTEIEFKDGNLRKDTLKTYTSQVNILKDYILIVADENMMCFNFDSDFVGKYLDNVRYEKGRSARTRDNYLMFLGTLSRWLISKKYITANPTEHFSKINRKEKKRIIISESDRIKIFNYWSLKNNEYLLLCLVCYYCLIRRTELTKLKVADFNPEKNTIWIGGGDSKNRKGNHVTVPREVNNLLISHISKAMNSDFLFSTDKFTPGPEQCNPDKITKYWARMRTELKLSAKIDWYSLKDTGITDLLKAGVPLISVRDQARHYSSKQTDEYTPRNLKNADATIMNSNVKFH